MVDQEDAGLDGRRAPSARPPRTRAPPPRAAPPAGSSISTKRRRGRERAGPLRAAARPLGERARRAGRPRGAGASRSSSSSARRPRLTRTRSDAERRDLRRSLARRGRGTTGCAGSVLAIPLARAGAAPARDRSPCELDRAFVGKSKPVITFTSVDLPAPFGPISPTTSCRCSSSETSCSACTPSKERETEEARSVSPGLLCCLAASAVRGTLAPG